jgi:hypothetical protein
MSIDGALPVSNQRQWNVKDGSTRSREYHNWRISLGLGHVQDIDQLEYTIVDGNPKPVMIVELTKAEGKVKFPGPYMQSISNNIARKRQRAVARSVASSLDIPAWMLLYEDNFTRMWVKDIKLSGSGWVEISMKQWERYLRDIHNESNT